MPAGDGAAVHRARRGRLRDGAGHRQPARSGRRRARDQAADARRRLHRAAHRRLPLQRPPAAHALPGLRRSARQVPHQSRATSAPASGATSSSPPSARWRSTRASRCASASTAARSIRSSSLAKMQENTDRNLGRDSEEILNECMVISASSPRSSPSSRACARTRSSSRARCRGRATSSPSTASSRARPTSRCTSASPKPAWARRGWCGRRRPWASC